MYQAFISKLTFKQPLGLFILLLGSILCGGSSFAAETTAPIAPAASGAPAEPTPSVTPIEQAASTPTATPIPTVFEEGKHYQRLSTAVTTHKTVQQFVAENPGKIQVIEFFNYGCFWCRQLHPVLNTWALKKPESVVFYRYPVVFNKLWGSLAKTYLVINALKKTEMMDPLFFTEIHQNHVNLADEKLLKPFLVKHGISEKEFFELSNSFAINTEMTKINEIANAYQITLSPSVVINTPSGSYLSTAAMVGSEEGLISLMNFLIQRDTSKLPNQP